MDNISIFSIAPQFEEVLYLQVGSETIELTPTPTTERILEAIQWSLDLTIQDNEIVSEAVKIMFMRMGMVKAFTNIEIDFADKTVADIYSAYDTIVYSGLINEIKIKASKTAIEFFEKSFCVTVENIITYRQSAAGILTTITRQAQTSTAEMKENLEFASRSENLKTLTNLVNMAEKLGYNPA